MLNLCRHCAVSVCLPMDLRHMHLCPCIPTSTVPARVTGHISLLWCQPAIICAICASFCPLPQNAPRGRCTHAVHAVHAVRTTGVWGGGRHVHAGCRQGEVDPAPVGLCLVPCGFGHGEGNQHRRHLGCRGTWLQQVPVPLFDWQTYYTPHKWTNVDFAYWMKIYQRDPLWMLVLLGLFGGYFHVLGGGGGGGTHPGCIWSRGPGSLHTVHALRKLPPGSMPDWRPLFIPNFSFCGPFLVREGCFKTYSRAAVKRNSGKSRRPPFLRIWPSPSTWLHAYLQEKRIAISALHLQRQQLGQCRDIVDETMKVRSHAIDHCPRW